MPPVSVLIKPASSACNMRCRYCFYRDEADSRRQASYGLLSLETAEKLIARAAEYAEGSCTFMFQGGEPTLAGLPFYRAFLELEGKYKKPGLGFRHAIQTNGYALDEEWARFFAENRFLVGVSLDGPADIHNLNRPDNAGGGSFNRVMRSLRLLRKFGADFNILSVVTGRSARSALRLYAFFKKNGFRYLQFIPCLEPLGGKRGGSGFALSPEDYAQFLDVIFNLWLEDFRRGEYISIRHIDNMLFMLCGKEPELCAMSGRCSVQFVIEGDGGVYPCDFYVLDEWRLGSVWENSFRELADCETAKRFVEASLTVPEKCKTCRWAFLCRNGCRRDRLTAPDGTVGLNYYCGAYGNFYQKNERGIREALSLLR